MSEHDLRGAKPQLLRYKLQTKPGLSAEEAELYLSAVIDDVCLASLLAEVASGNYENRQKDEPHAPKDFVRYRRSVKVLSISYENPWEIFFDVIESAGTIAALITTFYNLRGGRRKTRAETEKLRAETRKLDAETRNLGYNEKTETLSTLRKQLDLHEQALQQMNLASDLISKERQDRRTRELLAEIILDDQYQTRFEDVYQGTKRLKAQLVHSLDATMKEVIGPAAVLDFDGLTLTRLLADHPRLIASLQRLDEVERSAEAVDGDGHG
jgi:hypothetical protein